MSWTQEKVANESLKFDQSAMYYDMYRPGYPKELVQDIGDITGISSQSRLLEIGAGSGKATDDYVKKGYQIDCYELGPTLASIGINKFRSTGRVHYHIGRFEHQDLPSQVYDLVFCAQAFHWIEKPLGYERIHHCLSKASYMALYWNRYYDDGSPETKVLYDICRTYQLLPVMTRDEINQITDLTIKEIDQTDLFGRVKYREYPWSESTTKKGFINFLKTSNSYIGMDESLKRQLHKELNQLFDPKSQITRRYITSLYLVKKK